MIIDFPTDDPVSVVYLMMVHLDFSHPWTIATGQPFLLLFIVHHNICPSVHDAHFPEFINLVVIKKPKYNQSISKIIIISFEKIEIRDELIITYDIIVCIYLLITKIAPLFHKVLRMPSLVELLQ